MFSRSSLRALRHGDVSEGLCGKREIKYCKPLAKARYNVLWDWSCPCWSQRERCLILLAVVNYCLKSGFQLSSSCSEDGKMDHKPPFKSYLTLSTQWTWKAEICVWPSRPTGWYQSGNNMGKKLLMGKVPNWFVTRVWCFSHLCYFPEMKHNDLLHNDAHDQDFQFLYRKSS